MSKTPDKEKIFVNENSLHSSLKKWYSQPGDRLEVRTDDFVIDIVRDGLLVEIQTSNFSAIKIKLNALVQNHRVRLVHPIPRKKWIIRVLASNGRVVSRRKSPKKGRLIEIFHELVRIPNLINHENFSLEVLIIKEEEVRCADGRGSWRRRGVSIRDKRLLGVLERIEFNNKYDFLRFLPENLPVTFSNKDLAESLRISRILARKVTYCLKKMDVIKPVGKKGKSPLFRIA